MQNKEILLKLDYQVIKNDFIRAGEASSNIKKMMTQIGIDPKIVRRIAIVTYEAEMNLVIHSKGGGINVSVTSEEIDILAWDKGPGIKDIELAMMEGYSTAPNNVREMGFGAGMGLPNIKKCSDEFSIESTEGKETKVYIKIFLDNTQKEC